MFLSQTLHLLCRLKSQDLQAISKPDYLPHVASQSFTDTKLGIC